MKHLATILILMPVLLMLSACGPQGPSQGTPTGFPADLSPTQLAAITAVSKELNLPIEKIQLVSIESVTWTDGCLGVQRPGVLCTQAMVPGFRIVLEANGAQFEFHTNQDGSLVVRVDGAAGMGPPEGAAIRQLSSNLGLPEAQVQLIGSSSVEWPDTCLGVGMEGMTCAQVVTPGRLIVLEAHGRQYEYHTDRDGGRIVPAALALTWKQEGGIAGFCQGLTVYLSGEVYILNCRAQFDGRMGVLSADERTQLYGWLAAYGVTVLDASDPKGVADGMTRLLDLFGSGDQHPGDGEQAAMFSWAQALYWRLNQ